jgi:hypothetical protein
MPATGHSRSINRSSAARLDKFAFDLQDEDILIVNDPYAGAEPQPADAGDLDTMWATTVLFPACRVAGRRLPARRPLPGREERFQEGTHHPAGPATAGRIEKDMLSRLLKNKFGRRYRATR